ncbi:MAG: hypothetical protein CL844_00315 [Crocinitomicaceae bacterium]|nr:hypothetical protein [Crocinitomicaceae bacterium]|tara:strand:- start:1784 stop:2728 length:945 start_codon:yes stop_codon:yes gene_type:complete
MKYKNSRRKFLRNTSLSLLSIAAFPSVVNSATSKKNDTKDSCDETTLDAYGQGPFYTANAPLIQNNQLANINESGERIIISGQVYNLDCSEAIPNTEIDVWHANNLGEYDNFGYNLRGKTMSNSQGYYIFESIKPGLYLNGSTYRPSHIHFKITPPGFNTLITQLYFENDPYIPTDAAASITSGQYDATNRIIPLTQNTSGDLEGTWDIIINGDGIPIVGMNNLHLSKGMIYNAYPNPFVDEIEINYGVFQKGNVKISVHDINGQMVATLNQKMLEPEKYQIVWRPHIDLPKGHYFISIVMNDMQVHYIKVLKQ